MPAPPFHRTKTTGRNSKMKTPQSKETKNGCPMCEGGMPKKISTCGISKEDMQKYLDKMHTIFPGVAEKRKRREAERKRIIKKINQQFYENRNR